MATFLELCQMVARESGIISGVLPISVTGQTGREGKVVYWVQEAWRRLQTSRSGWLWMQGEFSGSVGPSTQRYTGASFGLTRWAKWITAPDSMTIYLTSTGVSDENPIGFIPFSTYRAVYERGTRVATRPNAYSVSPAGELCVPYCDATYTLRGEYRKSAQSLAANGDIPEMPVDFHDIIAWSALELMAEHDEGEFHVLINRGRKAEQMAALLRDQLPEIGLGGPLA